MPPIIEYRPGPLFIAGGPGAGKTTLATWLSGTIGWPVLSSRDVVMAVDPGAIASGSLGDISKTLAGLAVELHDYRAVHGRSFIVDGCPRTPDQAALVEPDDMVIYLWCHPSRALERLVTRGRPDDTVELATKRVAEQYGPDDTWVRELATWQRRLNTTDRRPGDVARLVYGYLAYQRREVF